MNLSVCVLFLLSLCYASVHCAKILCFAPMPSPSHFTIASTIYKELARKGHEVTVVSPYPQAKPLKNYKDIAIPELITSIDDTKKNLFNMNKMSLISSLMMISFMTGMVTETVLSNSAVKKLLKSNEKFDAVVMEYFGDEALMAFSSHFEAPLILISPMPASTWTNHLVANPGSSAYIPSLLSEFGSEMSFFERIVNIFYDTIDEIVREFVTLPQQEKLVQKYFPNPPPFSEIIHNTSVFLINSHESINSAVPLVPNMIEIGGYHVAPPQELPKDLKDFMDSAKEGVIVFSLGSNLKSADLPLHTRSDILKALSKLKQKVLWKFEVDLPNLPSNVKILKWLPQKDLLAHPNIACLISHGGALSTIEAVYFGVPMIGIPVFGDQMMNMARAEKEGYALNLPFSTLNEESLTKALHQVLGNSRYKDEIKRRSDIMRDRQVKPLDTATYWIEYAIRHKGAPHLRSPGLKLKWYQRNLLDVYLFIFTLVLVFVYLVTKCCKACFCKKSKTVDKVSKSKKQK